MAHNVKGRVAKKPRLLLMMRLPVKVHQANFLHVGSPDNMSLKMLSRYFHKLIEPIISVQMFEVEDREGFYHEYFACAPCFRL